LVDVDGFHPGLYNGHASLFAGAQCIVALKIGAFVVETHKRPKTAYPQCPLPLTLTWESEALAVDSFIARLETVHNIIGKDPQALSSQGRLRFEPNRPRGPGPLAGVKNA